MKKWLLAWALLLWACSARAQGQWDWTNNLPLQQAAVSASSAGRIYVSGYFTGTIVIGGTHFTAVGSNDGFIGCFSSNGGLVWGRQLSSQPSYPQTNPQSVYPSGIATDGLGNSYVTGDFTGRITPPSGAAITAPHGWNAVFTAKYTSSGSLAWIRMGSCHQYYSQGGAIAVDGSGNSYVTGSVTSPAVFDNLSASFTGKRQVFVASYSPTGVIRWLTTGSGMSNTNLAQSVAVDDQGGVYVTGRYYQQLTLGSITLPANISGGVVYPNQFVTKIRSTNGQVLWTKWAGGPNLWMMGEGVASDAAGNCYVVGRYGSLVSPSTPPTAYVIRYTSTNAVDWMIPLDATYNQGLCRIVVTRDGTRCYVLSDRTTVSPASLILRRLEPATGATLWRITTRGDVHPYSLSLGTDGQLFATGPFTGTAVFGNTMLNTATSASLLTRISEAAVRSGATSLDVAALAADVDGNVYPNPAQDWATITLPPGQAVHATIRDTYGRPWLSTPLKANRAGQGRLDVRALPAGNYILELRDERNEVKRQHLQVNH